jgi:class 3 adenylate cyclase
MPLSADAPALPEGTVTVLSTDLVGSTALNQRLGDKAATAVERELAGLALAQVEKQRGVVVKDTGDGLMVAFQSARRAVLVGASDRFSCADERELELKGLASPIAVMRIKW